jgi:hypothetical protein
VGEAGPLAQKLKDYTLGNALARSPRPLASRTKFLAAKTCRLEFTMVLSKIRSVGPRVTVP